MIRAAPRTADTGRAAGAVVRPASAPGSRYSARPARGAAALGAAWPAAMWHRCKRSSRRAPTPRTRGGASAQPQVRGALAAVPAPVLVTGGTAVPPPLVHEAPASLAGARVPHRWPVVRPMAAPIGIARGAPASVELRHRASAACARPRLRPGWRRPLDAVGTPIHGAARAAPMTPLRRGADPPTDATDALRHPSRGCHSRGGRSRPVRVQYEAQARQRPRLITRADCPQV
jgi:hypothetical protein